MDDQAKHIRAFPTENLKLVSFACVVEEEGVISGHVERRQEDDIYDEEAYGRFLACGVDTTVCAVCGHSLLYFCIVEHVPTGVFYSVGRDCFANIECLQKYNAKISLAYSNPSKQIAAGKKAAKEKKAGDVREEAFFTLHPEFASAYEWAAGLDLTQFTGSLSHRLAWPVATIKEMRSKVRQYGSLSELQIALAVRVHSESLANIESSLESEANTKAAIASGLRGPEGKQTVSGKVLSTKQVESDFGVSTKVLVELANGTKVYGTLPSAASGNKGIPVRFTATFEVSTKDPLFSFFKRPSQWVESPVGEQLDLVP